MDAEGKYQLRDVGEISRWCIFTGFSIIMMSDIDKLNLQE